MFLGLQMLLGLLESIEEIVGDCYMVHLCSILVT
jgi:hypothetical protein